MSRSTGANDMPVDAYLTARAAFTEAQSAIRKIGDDLAVVGGALAKTPGLVSFSNQRVGLPAEATLSNHAQVFDAARWPSPEDITQLLAAYHQHKAAMLHQWSMMASEQRDGCKPPDELLR